MENGPWIQRSNGKCSWIQSSAGKILFPYWVFSLSSTIACFISKFFTSIAVCWNVNITIFIFLNFQGSDTKVEKLYLWAAIEEEEYGWTSYGPSLKHNPPHKDMPNLVEQEEIEKIQVWNNFPFFTKMLVEWFLVGWQPFDHCIKTKVWLKPFSNHELRHKISQNDQTRVILAILGVPEMGLRVSESKFWDH